MNYLDYAGLESVSSWIFGTGTNYFATMRVKDAHQGRDLLFDKSTLSARRRSRRTVGRC
jgi:hypothetical protein